MVPPNQNQTHRSIRVYHISHQALEHLEHLRLEAMEAERRDTEERHRRLSEDIRQSFEARRRQNSARINQQLASASFVPVKPMYYEEEEEDDDDEGEEGSQWGGGSSTSEYTYNVMNVYTKTNARPGVQLPSLVQPDAKRHRRRSKSKSRSNQKKAASFGASSNRGGAAEEEKKDVANKLAELDDFDTRVSYFHTTTLKQRLEARGWGNFDDDKDDGAAEKQEDQRPPTVLTNPNYADYFA